MTTLEYSADLSAKNLFRNYHIVEIHTCTYIIYTVC